jgi:hypothetical protein
MIWLILLGLMAATMLHSMWRHRDRWIDLVPVVNDLFTLPARSTQDQPVSRPVPVMSRDHWQATRRRQLVGRRQSYHALKLKTEMLQTHVEQLQNQIAQQARDITDGQESGIREFLKKEKDRKPFTRTGVTKLLGMDKTKGLNLIAAVQEKVEREERLAAPLPPEIAKPAPLPSTNEVEEEELAAA